MNLSRSNKKDFILFQLDVALKDAGSELQKKSEVVNQIAETISRINKAEDFTKQQDYIKQCSEILKIDEGGLHALVNKFIRNKISTQEKALPFEEARSMKKMRKKRRKQIMMMLHSIFYLKMNCRKENLQEFSWNMEQKLG